MELLNRISLAYRFVFRQKSFAIINILRLALGIEACLLITHQYVMFHRSFDKHTPSPSSVYRVNYSRWQENGARVEFASASPTIGPAIAKLFPEAETYGRVYRVRGVFAHDDNVYKEEDAFGGETELLKYWGLRLLMVH